MTRPVLRHIAGTVAVLAAVSVATYALILLAPGDAATSLATARAGPRATPEQVETLRRQLGLDSPGPVQYWHWISGALTGDLGTSIRTGRPVASELRTRIPVTLFLAGGAVVIAFVIGLVAGVTSAVARSSAARGVLRIAALLAVSVPSFWLSYLLILVLAERLGAVPTSGQGGPASWLMPWLVLSLPAAGILSRVVSTTVREALDQPYVTAARARGASLRSIVWRDALPNAAGAILSVSGLLLASLVAGTLIVETVFAWPGVGTYFVGAVSFRDIPALQASVLLLAAGFVLANRLADLAHHLLDPRLRTPARTVAS
jgi:peptide/nickel transport system permease protein